MPNAKKSCYNVISCFPAATAGDGTTATAHCCRFVSKCSDFSAFFFLSVSSRDVLSSYSLKYVCFCSCHTCMNSKIHFSFFSLPPLPLSLLFPYLIVPVCSVRVRLRLNHSLQYFFCPNKWNDLLFSLVPQSPVHVHLICGNRIGLIGTFYLFIDILYLYDIFAAML